MISRIVLDPLPRSFENLPDPRTRSGRRYHLKVLLTTEVVALMQGATGVTSISEWIRTKTFGELFRLGYQSGSSPFPATFYNVFVRIDTVALERKPYYFIKEEAFNIFWKIKNPQKPKSNHSGV